MNYLSKETDYIAWYPAYNILQKLRISLVNTKYYQGYQVNYTLKKVGIVFLQFLL